MAVCKVLETVSSVNGEKMARFCAHSTRVLASALLCFMASARDSPAVAFIFSTPSRLVKVMPRRSKSE
jgi:hypothetical protein